MSDARRASPTFDDEVFDAYPAPTMIVDAAMRVLTMNRAARASLLDDGPVSRLVVARVGNDLACITAAGPGGCGGDPSCQACAVRASRARLEGASPPPAGGSTSVALRSISSTAPARGVEVWWK